MNEIGKFLADADKLKKYDRQQNGAASYGRIGKQLRRLFESAAGCPGELPSSVFDYWERTFAEAAGDAAPDEKQLLRLAAFLSFLCGTREYEDSVSDEDWQELGSLVNYEAEELPVPVLQELMAVLVEKGAY